MPRIPSLRIGDFLLLLTKRVRRKKLSRRAVDTVLFVRTKTVNHERFLREARPLVVAELREIDADTVGVESAIALDEMTSKKAVES